MLTDEKSLLQPIPVGVNVMDLPVTEAANKHAWGWDFLTKWPLVFPVSDQKSISIAQLLAEQVIPVHGVPKAPLCELAITFDDRSM